MSLYSPKFKGKGQRQRSPQNHLTVTFLPSISTQSLKIFINSPTKFPSRLPSNSLKFLQSCPKFKLNSSPMNSPNYSPAKSSGMPQMPEIFPNPPKITSNSPIFPSISIQNFKYPIIPPPNPSNFPPRFPPKF